MGEPLAEHAEPDAGTPLSGHWPARNDQPLGWPRHRHTVRGHRRAWLDGRKLAAELSANNIPGTSFVPIEFTPTSSKFANEKCGGINVIITDRERFEPLRTGFEIASTLRKLYPQEWETKGYARLLGNAVTLAAVEEGKSADEILAVAREGVEEFKRRREAFLLYE